MKPVFHRIITRKENWRRRLPARLLISSSAISVLFLSLKCLQAQPASQAAEFAPVRTPQNVQVNRAAPAFTPASQRQPISENPSDTEVQHLLLFSERLVPVEPAASRSVMDGLKGLFGKRTSPATNQDNRHVVSTLRAVQSSSSPYETTHLEAFIKTQPQSRWTPGLRHELARRQFKQGWFAQAIAGWDRLWDELKDRREPGAVEVANEVLSHLLDAYIGLGKADRLTRLIGEQESRPGHPVIQAKLLRARQSVWLLKHRGSQNVMCGPIALYCVLQQRQQPFTPVRLNDVTDDFIATGIPLSQLQKYANAYKMDLVAARRSAGDPIPTPAVMHLSAGHYSAILEQTNGYYLLEDRPLQFKGWVSLEALEAQASGYFLIPRSSLIAGWQPVSEQEASTVFGRDGAHGTQPLNQSVTDCSPTVGGDDSNCKGMPSYTFHQQIAALRVQDIPVGYRPPVGPSVFTRIAYNDLDDSKPVGTPIFSNVGRIWSINWLAYAEVTWQTLIIAGQTVHFPRYPVTVHVPGGGTEVYRSEQPHDRSFARLIISTNGVLCTRILADGSQELYNTGGILSPTFLTQSLDPFGNALSFSYDANLRLVAITDAIGQVTTFEHNWPGDIWKVTRITDPFGRFASFAYNNPYKELSSVTDVIGLTTTFTYDTNEFLTSMTTPYGTTMFANTRPIIPNASYDYSLTATDPDGNRERVHYIEPIDVPPFGPPLPANINVGGTNIPFVAEDARLQFRNSYYWDKKAMKLGPGNIAVARNYRWLTDASYLITPILEAYKEPLEGRIWFNYPGHIAVGGEPYAAYPYYPGLGGRPEKVLRMLADGTPQLLQTYYNAQGYLTNLIDPLGRATIYNYASNLMDLVEVRQKTGTATSERLAAITWNNQHLPLTFTDAAGQTNRFAYNARGQLLSYTDALNQPTTLFYDSNGFLITIDGPLAGTNDSTRFTYDAFGRVRTLTSPDDVPVTFDYDALDRVTLITFPDGTYEQFGYTRLDRSFARDRLGRRTDYTWNSLRQLVQMKDPLNRVTRFDWCECGTLNSITDPLGRMTSWQYDIQSRKIAKQLPDGAKISYAYEPLTSRLKSITDEKGQTKAYEYYADDNLRRISYVNAQVPTPNVTCQYDSNYNRMATLTDGSGTTTWNYHPAGVLGAFGILSVTASWNNAPVSYHYDALGRATNRVIGGVSQAHTFDPLGRITNIVNTLGSFGYAYDGVSTRVMDAFYPTGQRSHFDYFDNLGDRRLQRITHTRPNASIISRFNYAYDAVGNITNWVQELGTLTNIWRAGYDVGDQLSTVQITQGGSATTYAYSYDDAGNRLFEDVNGIRRNFNYNVLNQLVSSSDSTTNAVNYDWDAEARLRAITRGTNRSEFTYDGFGRRIGIVEKQNGVVVSNVSLLWCDGEICEIRDAAGSTVLRRLFAQGESVSGGGNYLYTKDHLGSIREVLDGGGNVATRYSYSPFGTQVSLAESFKPTFGFAGYFVHSPSRLNLTLFRALDAEAGRWLSRDPLQERAGINLYAYVKNKPLVATDPLGLEGECTSFNVNAAVEHLNSNADPSYQERNLCAQYTMNAVDKGCGLSAPSKRPRHAYQFGDLLSSMGFDQVATSDFQAGDVIVFDRGDGAYSSGHMQMFNGTRWVSDFMQSADKIYPGPGQWKNLDRKVYRHRSVPTVPKAPSCGNNQDNPRDPRPWANFGRFADFL